MKGTWSQIDLAGKPADVYDLPAGQRPRFGVLYLHSYARESLQGKDAFTQQLDARGLVCVCPSGGHAWWGDRVCPTFDSMQSPERYLLDTVMPFFRSRWSLDARAIGLLGISMGGQGALRLACKYPKIFATTAAIASVIEYQELYGLGSPLDDLYQSKEQCRQDTVPMYLRQGHAPAHLFFCCDPEDPTWFRGNDRLHDKFNALGIAHECDLTTSAGGHTWDYFNHMAGRAIGFLATGLEQESRRLL